jgi:hypothetical protein
LNWIARSAPLRSAKSSSSLSASPVPPVRGAGNNRAALVVREHRPQHITLVSPLDQHARIALQPSTPAPELEEVRDMRQADVVGAERRHPNGCLGTPRSGLRAHAAGCWGWIADQVTFSVFGGNIGWITVIAVILLAYVVLTLVAMLATGTHISGGYTPAH